MARHGKAPLGFDDDGVDEYKYHSPPPVIHLPSKPMQEFYDSKFGSIFRRLTKPPPGYVDPVVKAKAEKAKAKAEKEEKAKKKALKELFGEPDAWTRAKDYLRNEGLYEKTGLLIGTTLEKFKHTQHDCIIKDMMVVRVLSMRHIFADFKDDLGEGNKMDHFFAHYYYAKFQDESGECHGSIDDKTGTIHPGCVLLLLNVKVKRICGQKNDLDIRNDNIFKVFPMKEEESSRSTRRTM